MKHFSFLISILLVFQYHAQFQFDNTIEKDNCRHGENVEYCRTHKVMNFFKLTFFFNENLRRRAKSTENY